MTAASISAASSQKAIRRYARQRDGYFSLGWLVSARVPDADCARYEAILNQSAVNLRDLVGVWI
jgi:hypothetical protein